MVFGKSKGDFGQTFNPDSQEQNRLHTLAENVQRFVFENLSEEERKINGKDGRAALIGFALEVKPAVFLGTIDEEISNSKAIVDFFSDNGFDVLIYGPFLINRKLLMQRIATESDFARELGWGKGMVLEDFIMMTSPYEKNILGEARTGFILGFPQSAIRSFAGFLDAGNREALRAVNIYDSDGGRVYYFSTGKIYEHAPDVEELKEQVVSKFAKAGYKKPDGEV